MGDPISGCYECAHCGRAAGQYGHFKGSFDGTEDEWACDPDDRAAFVAQQTAKAYEVYSNFQRPLAEQTWTITLNSYQRSNLLMLLRVCGYPHSDDVVEPFNSVNNGDWLGEIARMLEFTKDNGEANFTPESLRTEVSRRTYRGRK